MLKNKNFDAAAAIATSKFAEDSGITSSHLKSSAFLAANIGSSAILDRHLSPKLRLGFIPIDISAGRIVGSTNTEAWANATSAAGKPAAGGMSDTTSPSYSVLSTAARMGRIQWSSAATTEVQFPAVLAPPDFSTQSAAKFHCIANTPDASTDASPTIRLIGWLSTGSSGGTQFASTTIAVSTASTVPTTHSVAFNASLYMAYPNILTFTVGITSTKDKIAMHGAWVEYTRTSTV